MIKQNPPPQDSAEPQNKLHNFGLVPKNSYNPYLIRPRWGKNNSEITDDDEIMIYDSRPKLFFVGFLHFWEQQN